MLLTLFTSVLLILLIQSVNGMQYFNTNFIFPLFGTAVVPVIGTVIIHLTNMYGSP